jgi:hypothetical protein
MKHGLDGNEDGMWSVLSIDRLLIYVCIELTESTERKKKETSPASTSASSSATASMKQNEEEDVGGDGDGEDEEDGGEGEEGEDGEDTHATASSTSHKIGRPRKNPLSADQIPLFRFTRDDIESMQKGLNEFCYNVFEGVKQSDTDPLCDICQGSLLVTESKFRYVGNGHSLHAQCICYATKSWYPTLKAISGYKKRYENTACSFCDLKYPNVRCENCDKLFGKHLALWLVVGLTHVCHVMLKQKFT